MASTNGELAPPSKPRISPLEYRNADLVSRLLAATPPYLYNTSMAPNTYFFSEMLRSFVQAKADRSAAPAAARRSRKRSWTQTQAQAQGKPAGEDVWRPRAEAASYYDERKLPPPASALPSAGTNAGMYAPPPPAGSTAAPSAPSAASVDGAPGLVLPPPPPIWYPPLYGAPPYGIDPLHFFIDLRVSGHIYDRKKALDKAADDAAEPAGSHSGHGKAGAFKSSKHASAFSVPAKAHASHPINLSKVEDVEQSRPLRFDVKSLGLEGGGAHNKTGVGYVMNNIERVYRDLREGVAQAGAEERQKRALKELIGLELTADGDAGVPVEVVDEPDAEP